MSNAQKWLKKQNKLIENWKMEKNKSERVFYRKNRKKIIKMKKKYYFKLRSELIENLGKKCSFCGINEDLHFHHNVPMVVYNNKIYHYKKNIDLLCLLCEKCHNTYHMVMDDLRIDKIFKETFK